MKIILFINGEIEFDDEQKQVYENVTHTERMEEEARLCKEVSKKLRYFGIKNINISFKYIEDDEGV